MRKLMTMLRGVSSRMRNFRVWGHQRAWRYSNSGHILHKRESSTGGGNQNCGAPLADQSFTATHYAADGRRFEFATVVVKAMKNGQSSKNLWHQACSLIGSTSPPTLAVAFVSKPTISALQAIQDLSQMLAVGSKPLADSCKDSGDTVQPRLDATCRTILHVDALQSFPIPVLNGASEAAGTSVEKSVGQPILIPPLIGCLMDGMAEFESSEAGPAEASLSQTHRNSSPNSSTFRSRTDRAFGCDRNFFDEDDEDEGTLSDWEGVCAEIMEETSKREDVRSAKGNQGDEEDELTPCDKEVSKEGLVSFLNALTKPAEKFSEDIRMRGRDYKFECSERHAVMEDREVDKESLYCGLLGSNIGHRLLTKDIDADNACMSTDPVTSQSGKISEGCASVQTCSEKTGNGTDSELEKSDENYKLVLCIGRMPGAKAVAFYSSTTGLPRLPDMKEAVTVNNPHMLLLGAPGFVFPDFIQRLSSVFPLSCKAGAFLAPLFTSKRSQWTRVAAEQTSSPLFYGNKVATTGVVGLAISPKGKGVEIPAEAFAEFVRMSLAMPRLPGFVFLDEPISRRLFFPKNVAAPHPNLSTRSILNAPNLVLDQLSKKLLRESTVPSVRKGAKLPDENTDQKKKIDKVVGLESYPALHISSKQDAGVVERLPLALFDSVLFPGWSMPFHIFDPCYRFMVRHCLEEGKPFGLLAVYSDAWTADGDQTGEVIGTVANMKIYSFQRDCRSYIIAHGVRRFRVPSERICAEPSSFGLTMGQVQFFDDKECEAPGEEQEVLELAKRAVALCLEVIPEGLAAPGLVKSAHDPVVASFAIGHIMNVPVSFFLQMSSRAFSCLVDFVTQVHTQHCRRARLIPRVNVCENFIVLTIIESCADKGEEKMVEDGEHQGSTFGANSILGD